MAYDSLKATIRHILSGIRRGFAAITPLQGVIIAFVFMGSILLIAVALLGLLDNPFSTPVEKYSVAEPQCQVVCYDSSLEPYEVAWATEIDRRFTGPSIAILAHGGGPEAARWLVEDNPGGGYGTECEDTLALADRTHAEHPDVIIILLCCNPSHVAVHGRPWLYYAPDSVWCVPDHAQVSDIQSYLTTDGRSVLPNVFVNRSALYPGAVGSAFELIEGN
jgi:hypothetical protein